MASTYDRNDESTPLLRSQQEQNNIDTNARGPSHLSSSSKDCSSSDDPFDRTRSTFYLILLTLPIGGLQLIWSLEFSNGSPFLLSLGMSKALLAFVLLAAPVTGVFVQPYIGMASDRSRISWGRRKPFMIAGTLGTAIFSLLLAYSRQIVQLIGGWGPNAVYEGDWQSFTIALAAVLMWALDFSVNAGKQLRAGQILMLMSSSTSSQQSIHRGRSAIASARSCKCMGFTYDWNR